MHHSRLWLFGTLTSFLFLFEQGCSDPNTSLNDPLTSDAGVTAPSSEPDDGGPINIYYDAGDMFTGAKVVGVLHAMNQGAIQEAALARVKANDPNVLALAKSIEDACAEADQGLLQVAPYVAALPAETDISRWLEGMTTRDVTTLANDAAFDAAYVQDQIIAHHVALNLIDTLLTPSAPNPTIMTQVLTARAVLAPQLASLEAMNAPSAPANAAIAGATAVAP